MRLNQGYKSVLTWSAFALTTFVLSACSQGPFATNWSGSSNNVNVDNAFSTAAIAVLQTNCNACHGSSPAGNSLANITDGEGLITAGVIIPGQPDQSTLYTQVTSGAMPQGGPTLAAGDQQALHDWIAAMTSN